MTSIAAARIARPFDNSAKWTPLSDSPQDFAYTSVEDRKNIITESNQCRYYPVFCNSRCARPSLWRQVRWLLWISRNGVRRWRPSPSDTASPVCCSCHSDGDHWATVQRRRTIPFYRSRCLAGDRDCHWRPCPCFLHAVIA